MGQPRPLFHSFLSFQTQITNFITNRFVKKCPSSIQCWDSDSRPLEHEFPPITTRAPGLPPNKFKIIFQMLVFFYSFSNNIVGTRTSVAAFRSI